MALGGDDMTKMPDEFLEGQRPRLERLYSPEDREADLRDEIAMLREVNIAQADNYWRLARQLADREEQLRKAQERIRAAEEKCELLNKAHAQMQRTMDRLVAERDKAWNEAIEAAARKLDEMAFYVEAMVIRSLAKEAGE
jgi:DNA repair exonuclease SbcCD ATPase subunit